MRYFPIIVELKMGMLFATTPGKNPGLHHTFKGIPWYINVPI